MHLFGQAGPKDKNNKTESREVNQAHAQFATLRWGNRKGREAKSFRIGYEALQTLTRFLVTSPGREQPLQWVPSCTLVQRKDFRAGFGVPANFEK